MDKKTEFTPEELQAMIEKAQREWQEKLAKMTPEEREQAEMRAKKIVEEDEAKRQALIEEAKRVAVGDYTKKPETPKFCPNCGAPVAGGKFCPNCGKPLQT